MKKKIHTVRAVPKKNMIERDKIDFPNKKKKRITCIGTGTSIQCGGVKLV